MNNDEEATMDQTPKTPEEVHATKKIGKTPEKKTVKRRLDFSEDFASTEQSRPEMKTKVKAFRPTVSLLLQPMLANTIYLCKPCSQDSRKGTKTNLPNGKTGIQLVMCDSCMDFNGDHRIKHLSEIAFPRKK